MSFEVGKYYRTRGGDLATIVGTQPDETYVLFGYITRPDGTRHGVTWTAKGTYYRYNMLEDPSDLIPGAVPGPSDKAPEEFETRAGWEVKIYERVDGPRPIIGAIKDPQTGFWSPRSWLATGKYHDERTYGCRKQSPNDLVPKRPPRVKRDVVLNVYPASVTCHPDEASAKGLAHGDIQARVKVLIDVPKGYGL